MYTVVSLRKISGHKTVHKHQMQSQLLLPDIGHLSGKYCAWPTIMEPA